MIPKRVHVIGGGLAGCEAAFQLAVREVPVTLHEMRPSATTPAHSTDRLAELVCSNSFKSRDPDTAAGLLKHELRGLGSLLLSCADAAAVPAGGALAVDRQAFSTLVERALDSLASLEIDRHEVTVLPEGPAIVATGPLTSPGLHQQLEVLLGAESLHFYDAAAPIVAGDSVDRSIVFAASRYDKGGGADYLNCPMDRDQYEAFVDAVLEAQRVQAREFENRELFAACQPIEEIVRKGRDAIRFGALKPVGIVDPSTGRRPWAVVQLRPEDSNGAAYNLVGFQTNLTFPEQRRVFQSIPGLQDAEFLRYGVMHRNTFVDAPRILTSDLAVQRRPSLRLAGQLTGTEGYLEAVASGLLAGLATYADLEGLPPVRLPHESAFGALVRYATDPGTSDYQPMHVNFGIMPPLSDPPRGKRERRAAVAAVARGSIDDLVIARRDLGIAAATAGASRLSSPEVPA